MHDPRLIPLKTMTSDILKVSCMGARFVLLRVCLRPCGHICLKAPPIPTVAMRPDTQREICLPGAYRGLHIGALTAI